MNQGLLFICGSLSSYPRRMWDFLLFIVKDLRNRAVAEVGSAHTCTYVLVATLLNPVSQKHMLGKFKVAPSGLA